MKTTTKPGRKPKPVTGCLARLLTMYGENLSAAARALCVSRQAVFVWVKEGRIPIRYALRVERLTGGLIDIRSILTEDEAASPPEVVIHTKSLANPVLRELQAAEAVGAERASRNY